MKKILIIGATSAIAEATARIWASRGDRLCLMARDERKLEVISADLQVRGASEVYCANLDVRSFAQHDKILSYTIEQLDGLDVVLIAHGTLPDQTECEADADKLVEEFETNALSTLAMLVPLSNYLQARGEGTIAVVTSVAGDRGRQSNYLYGAAKGCVSIYLQGLRNRLYKHGVKVVDIKPGFVDTPMTKQFKKGLLWAQPEAIARGIVSAVDRGRDVVYLPRFWRAIMTIIVFLPEVVFKRMKL